MVDTELQQQIDSAEEELSRLRSQIDDYTEEIEVQQEIRRETTNKDVRGRAGSEINALNKARGVVAVEFDKRNVRLGILRDSQSIAEAQQRTTRYRQQVQAEETRQAIQKGETQEERKIREQQIQEARELTGVSNIQFLSPQKQQELIDRAIIEKEQLKETATFTEIPPETIGREEIAQRRQFLEQQSEITQAKEEGRFVSRLELQEIKQQSLPLETFGIIPREKTFFEKIKTPIATIRESLPAKGTVESRELGSQLFASVVIGTTPLGAVGGLTKVRFTGAQQSVKANQVVTRVEFVAEKGTKIQRGVAESTSDILPAGDLFVVKSVTEVQKFRKSIEFPTGRTVKTPETKFTAGEVSLVGVKADTTVSAGLGRVQKDISKSDLTPFRTIAIARTKESKTGIISGTQIEAEDIIAGGVITRVPKSDDILFTIGKQKPSGLSTKQIQQIGLESAQSGITGAISSVKPVVTSIRAGAPATSIVSTISKTTPSVISQVKISTPKISGQQQVQSQVVTPSQQTRQFVRITQPTAQKVIQTPKITSVLAQPSAQKVIQTPKITPALAQPSAQRVAQAQKIVTPLRQKTTITPPPVIPITPFAPTGFAPISPRLKQRQQPQIRTAGFGVQVRRGGKFRSIGSGLSLRQAFEIGTQRVRTTLGATFKITSPSGKGVKGIPTPKGFRKKKGGLFIEKKELRLSTTPEVKEIQTARIKI